jgi:hypothetical protein
VGLREFGYIERADIAIEFRWAEGRYDRLSQLVVQLIGAAAWPIATRAQQPGMGVSPPCRGKECGRGSGLS